MGITEVVTAPRSPWQNAYAERVIGSIRRECLDEVVIFNERHLRRVLSLYVDQCGSSGEPFVAIGRGQLTRPASDQRGGEVQIGFAHNRRPSQTRSAVVAASKMLVVC